MPTKVIAKQSKSVTEIIAGALELFTTGPRGGKLRRARWNNMTLVKQDGAGEGVDTYCALGALAQVANGNPHDLWGSEFTAAADLVASCVPPYVWRREVGVDYKAHGADIPTWNDSLTQERGFNSIKRVFCKALKKSMPSAVKRTATKRRGKRAA